MGHRPHWGLNAGFRGGAVGVLWGRILHVRGKTRFLSLVVLPDEWPLMYRHGLPLPGSPFRLNGQSAKSGLLYAHASFRNE